MKNINNQYSEEWNGSFTFWPPPFPLPLISLPNTISYQFWGLDSRPFSLKKHAQSYLFMNSWSFCSLPSYHLVNLNVCMCDGAAISICLTTSLCLSLKAPVINAIVNTCTYLFSHLCELCWRQKINSLI